MENLPLFLALLTPGLITATVMSIQAPKMNARYRERRTAKLAARAAAE
ncbi:hypothetical protein [Microbacterium gorillae]|nr:hypothetical protein [Microbacterium gorillae]